MKAVCKKLFSLMLVAILLVSAVPFQVSAAGVDEAAATEAAVETVATEAAVAAVAEDIVEEKIEISSPAADAAVTLDKEVIYIQYQLDNAYGNYQVGSTVKSKIGSKVTPPSGSTALSVLASVIGSSSGYEFVRWEYEVGGERKTFTSSVTLNLSMDLESGGYYDEKTETSYDLLNVYAVIQEAAKTITLKPNGGTVASTSHTVKLGEQYDFYGGLPTPSRTNYTFAGWAKSDGTIVSNSDTVADLSALTAQWTANKYTVVYQGYDGGWTEVDFGSFSVEANSVLKTAYYNFPTDAQIKEMFLAPVSDDGWSIDGWEYSVDNGSTWSTFTAGSTKITGNTIIRPLYKKTITLYACDTGNTTRTLTVTLGKRYPTLPHPGTRDGYAFVGWYLDAGASSLVSTKANLSNTAQHAYVEYDAEALYAGWDVAKTVYLYIHTNGNTDEHTKLVRYYDVPESGFDLTEIDLADIFPSYGKYDDSVDEQYGWYDSVQWKNYVLGKHINDTTEYVVPSEINDDVLEFYIMLIDNGTSTSSANGSTYNDNSSTVDSSNPSTGDDIFVAVTVMAVSACALLLFFLNKKRFAK